MPEVCSGGLPHSEILGSKLGWQLPEALSSLPLPSSTPNASGIHQNALFNYLQISHCRLNQLLNS
jgi:hypothetical protein